MFFSLSVSSKGKKVKQNTCIAHCMVSGAELRFQSWGSNFLVYSITTRLQKKIDRSIQFGAVGYIITLYSSKSYVKSPFEFWGDLDPPTSSGCAHAWYTHHFKALGHGSHS